MKITLEHYKKRYVVETEYEDVTFLECLRDFVGLLEASGFHIPKEIRDASINEDWSMLSPGEEE